MADLSISTQDWARLKIKLQRKYNHLNEEDLAFNAGDEEKLISHLQVRLKRKREYVVFTLQKGLLNIENNRL
jgi:hypothetical protein